MGGGHAYFVIGGIAFKSENRFSIHYAMGTFIAPAGPLDQGPDMPTWTGAIVPMGVLCSSVLRAHSANRRSLASTIPGILA